jgi:hypothetical protein
MKRFAVMIGLMLLLVSPQARAQWVEIDEPQAPQNQEMPGQSQDEACDCCQKCKAATSDLKTQEEEGATEKDGCGDCCSRCSEPVKTLPHEPPPDVIDKAPPDIMEKEQ